MTGLQSLPVLAVPVTVYVALVTGGGGTRHVRVDRDATAVEVGRGRGRGLAAGTSLCGRRHHKALGDQAAAVDCAGCLGWLAAMRPVGDGRGR